MLFLKGAIGMVSYRACKHDSVPCPSRLSGIVLGEVVVFLVFARGCKFVCGVFSVSTDVLSTCHHATHSGANVLGKYSYVCRVV